MYSRKLSSVFVLAFAVATASSFAITTKLFTGPIPELKPTSMVQIDSFGNEIGPVIQLGDTNDIAAQSFTRQFDGRHMLIDGSGTSNQIYSATVFSGALIFTDGTTAQNVITGPMIVNDTVNTAGTNSRPTQRVRATVLWAPAGGTFASALTLNPNSNNVNLTVDYFNVGNFSDGADGFVYRNLLSGIRFNFGSQTTALASGFYSLNMTLPEASGLQLPSQGQDTGGHLVICRGRNFSTNAVFNLTAGQVANFGFRPICSPNDPVYPGTNPSDSSNLCWWDLSGDYGFATNEIFNMDGTSGRLQPCVSTFYDLNQTLVNATINFQDLSLVQQYPDQVDVDLVPTDAFGTPTAAASQLSVGVGANGRVNILNPQRGVPNMIFSFKRTHWLRKNSAVSDWTNPASLTFTLDLVNGDADNDNTVGPGDFAALSSAYGSTTGETNFDAMADFDEDGEVGPGDFAILSSNYGAEGDEDFTP